MAGRPPALQPPTAAVDDDRGRTSSRRIGGGAALACLLWEFSSRGLRVSYGIAEDARAGLGEREARRRRRVRGRPRASVAGRPCLREMYWKTVLVNALPKETKKLR